MGFKDELLKLAGQIGERREHITNEETTKNSLILPFIQTLGYDVFNPLEVRPEYDTSFGGAKNARIDYAVLKNGNPVIFIEAKAIGDSLKGHFSQLRSYFNATPTVRIAIITNGIYYKFYSDLHLEHLMDENPFLEIDVTYLSDEDIDVLNNFRCDEFDIQKILNYAEALTYTNNITLNLESVFREPSDDFIKYILSIDKSTFKVSAITSGVIEKFRPIVKKSISQALINLVQKGLATPAIVETAASTDSAPKTQTITTEEELKAFELIKQIITEEGRDPSALQFKDTTGYFGIYVKNPSHWIVRLNIDSSKKHVTTSLPIEKLKELAPGYEVGEANKSIGISRVYIDSIDDIVEIRSVIIEALNAAL